MIGKKRKISLEKEREINDLLWKEILNDVSNGNINIEKISRVMQRLNTFDLTLIEQNRRDLLG